MNGQKQSVRWNTQQRRDQILDRVRTHGSARLGELSDDLGVSTATVRRDLQSLAGQGLLTRTHGGAIPRDGRAVLLGGGARAERGTSSLEESIARAARWLVRPGDVVGFGAGTATHSVARQLAGVEPLTVVTNSVGIAGLFARADRPGRPGTTTATLVSGTRSDSDTLVGPLAVRAIRSFDLDVLFLSCHSVTSRGGLAAVSFLEAETNRAFIDAARRVVVIADHTKWASVALATFADLDEVDVLLTDSELSPAQRAATAARTGTLLVVDGPRAGREWNVPAGDPGPPRWAGPRARRTRHRYLPH